MKLHEKNIKNEKNNSTKFSMTVQLHHTDLLNVIFFIDVKDGII